MGTITISVDDDVEKQFRTVVQRQLGKKKGALGKGVTAAMEHWLKERQQMETAQAALSLLKKGFDLGKFKLKCREELYERR
jgi:hypothetical protein